MQGRRCRKFKKPLSIFDLSDVTKSTEFDGMESDVAIDGKGLDPSSVNYQYQNSSQGTLNHTYKPQHVECCVKGGPKNSVRLSDRVIPICMV